MEFERARREVLNIRVEEAKKLVQSLKRKGTLKVNINVGFLYCRPSRSLCSCHV